MDSHSGYALVNTTSASMTLLSWTGVDTSSFPEVPVQDASYASAVPTTSASHIKMTMHAQSDHNNGKTIKFNVLRSTSGTNFRQLAGLNVTTVPTANKSKRKVWHVKVSTSSPRPTKAFWRSLNNS